MSSSGTLIVVGGHSLEYANSVEYYDPEIDEWTKLLDLEVDRYGHTVTLLEGKLIFVGGSYEGIISSIVQSYDFPTGTLATLSSCNGPRYGHAAVVVQNLLYVLGGYDGHYLNTVESYDATTDTWTNLIPMQTIRETPGVAVFNDEIYVFGGYSFAENELESVESYNPVTGTWRFCTSMGVKRNEPAVATIGNLIYVVGGRSDENVLNTAVTYDPVLDQWASIHDSYIIRNRCKGCYFNDVLFVAGGEDKSMILKQDVETYDIESDTWSVKSNMVAARIRFSLLEVPWTAVEQTIALNKNKKLKC